MQSYEATPAELDKYGANLNIWQQLALLQAWAPLLSYGQRFIGESDPYRKSVIVGEAAEWLAAQSVGAEHRARQGAQGARLADVLKTPQGEALVREVVALVESIR